MLVAKPVRREGMRSLYYISNVIFDGVLVWTIMISMPTSGRIRYGLAIIYYKLIFAGKP
jgi:hypothetical protein